MATDEHSRSDLYRLRQCRLRLVEAMLDVHERWDAFNQVVTDSEDTAAAVAALAGDPFGYDATAAAHLLDLTMSRRTKAGRALLAAEASMLRDLIAHDVSKDPHSQPDSETQVRSTGRPEAGVDPRRREFASADLEAPFAYTAPILDVVDVAAESEFYRRLGMHIVHGNHDDRSVLVTPGIPLFGTKPALFVLQAGSGSIDHGGDDQRLVEVSDIDEAISACRSAGIDFEIGDHDADADFDPRYLKIKTPDGQKLVLQRP